MANFNEQGVGAGGCGVIQHAVAFELRFVAVMKSIGPKGAILLGPYRQG